MMWKKSGKQRAFVIRAGTKKRRWGRYVFGTVAGVTLAVALAGALLYFGSLRSLKGQAVTADAWDAYDSELIDRVLPDTVSWNGRGYRRNEEIYTILCMGIDTENDMVAEGTGMRPVHSRTPIFWWLSMRSRTSFPLLRSRAIP